MKKVLILVLSADVPPYKKMLDTALRTWDSINVENCETVYYCDKSTKPNTDKVIYLPTNFSLHTMGAKTLAAFEWALQNKEFDYVARVHSSCYVHKAALMQYINDLPYNNVFVGAEVADENKASEKWYWGGCHFIYSKDVIQKIVGNKEYWNHGEMEDKAVSYLINRLQIPVIPAKSGSIDNMGNHWRLVGYGSETISFTDFADVKKLNHHFYRVKQDGKREDEDFIMNALFKSLN